MENFLISGIGIGTPGPIDIEKGEIVQSGNLKNLKNTPVVQSLSKYSIPVFFNNDANCASLGEYFFGECRGSSNLIVLTLGTGLGCGWVYHGKIFNGWKGSGMEAGHTTVVFKDGAECSCGQMGCAEAYFSSSGFLRRYQKKTGFSPDSTEIFFKKVREKDKDAVLIFQEGLDALSALIRNLAHTVNPEAIVLVGGITASSDLILPFLRKEIKEKIFPVLSERLQIKIGGKVAGTIGAASLCFHPENTT